MTGSIVRPSPWPVCDRRSGLRLSRRRRGSVRPCARNGGGVGGSRRARTRFSRRPIGGGRAAVRTRCPCGRCGGGCRACGAIGAGGRSRSPCPRAVSPAFVAVGRGGIGWWNSTHEGFEAEAVMHVGTGDPQRQGQSVPVAEQVDFRSRLAAVGRIRSGQWPPFAARMLTESIAHRDQSNSPRAPSSSRMTRWSLAQTRSWLHWAKRR